jgi:hypothetical protein
MVNFSKIYFVILSFKMIELVIAILLHVLSNQDEQLVVGQDREISDLLSDESCFDPHRLSKDSLGNLVIKIDDECEDGECNPSSITTSRKCFRYILQLLSYIQQSEITMNEFFGFDDDYRRREIVKGIMFEYFLLLVQRYFELIAAEEDDYQDLLNLSDNDARKFQEKKKIAEVLLGLLKLASTDFPQNEGILPKLHALIDSFMRQFPDAMYLVVLANFRKGGFESLYLVENIYESLWLSEYSFRNEKCFQTLSAFKDFPLSSFFTTARLCSTFACLLKNYCVPHYNETECKKAIANVCAFLMKTLPNEAAFDALNQIFTELEKPTEMVSLILEAIFVIESEHLRGIIDSPEFPIHLDESLKRLADNLTDALTRKYDFLRDRLKKLCPKKDFVAALTAISEKYFVAGLIFERIFYKSLFDSNRKLEDVFDASFYECIQRIVDHSKILEGIKHQPEGLQLKKKLSELLRSRQADNDDFRLIGITGDMRVCHALNVVLKGAEQKRHNAQQIEWKRICHENNPPNYDDRRYQQAVQMNDLTQAAIHKLKLSRKEFIREIFAEIDLDIERIRAQLKPIDDQCLSISKENSALKSSMKHLICERLGLPRQE